MNKRYRDKEDYLFKIKVINQVINLQTKEVNLQVINLQIKKVRLTKNELHLVK